MCKGNECVIETDPYRIHWVAQVRRFWAFLRELDNVYALLTKAQEQEDFEADVVFKDDKKFRIEDVFNVSDEETLRQARDISLQLDDAGEIAVESKRRENPLADRLREHLSPFPFVKLGEYGLSFLSCVSLDGAVYRFDENQFDCFLRTAAERLYEKVYKKVKDVAQKRRIFETEGTPEADFYYDGACHELEELAGSFSRAFPSYCVAVFRLTGRPIIDEADTHVSGRTVCLRKENQMQFNIKKADGMSPQDAVDKLFPGHKYTPDAAKIDTRTLLRQMDCSKSIPLFDFLVDTTPVRYGCWGD